MLWYGLVRLNEHVTRVDAARKLKEYMPDVVIGSFGSPEDHYLYVVLSGDCYTRLGGELVECTRGGYDETLKVLPEHLPEDMRLYVKEIDATATSWMRPEGRLDIPQMQLG